MMASEQSLAMAALILVAFVIIALLIVAMRLTKHLQQQRQNQESIQHDLRSLCNAAVQVGERANRLEGELKALQQRQQELGVRQDNMAHAEPEEVTFEQAIKLAQKGASVEELMEICSISRGEAELIAMMHRLDSGT